MYVIVNIKKWNKAKESSRGCYIGLIIDYFVRSKHRHIDFILFLSVLHPSSGRPPRGRYSTLTHLGWTTLKGDIRWTFRLLHRVRGIFGTFASATDLCLVLVDWLGRVLLPASQVGTLRTAHNLVGRVKRVFDVLLACDSFVNVNKDWLKNEPARCLTGPTQAHPTGRFPLSTNLEHSTKPTTIFQAAIGKPGPR